MKTLELTINEQLATAIINDDFSGVDPWDERCLAIFMEEMDIEYIAPSSDLNIRYDECAIYKAAGHRQCHAHCIDVIAYQR